MNCFDNELYVIYDCDEWKTRSSMRIIMLSDKEHLQENLKEIQSIRDYTDEDMETYIYTEVMEINRIY